MTEWTTAKYPGDDVRITHLRHPTDSDMGFVTIQHYGAYVRVAAFLPGELSEIPGDTPKTNPEMYCFFPPERAGRANTVFDLYVSAAEDRGWITR